MKTPVKVLTSILFLLLLSYSNTKAQCDITLSRGGTKHFICKGDSVTIGENISIIGGLPPFEYAWSPEEGLSAPTEATPSAAPENTSTYTLTVTDATGCSATAGETVLVSISPPLTNGAFVSQDWMKRYGGQSQIFNTYNAVDRDSNFYVAGTILQPYTMYDYMVLKYDSAGNLLWAADFNGIDSLDEKLSGIKVDIFGNVFVTGSSQGNTSGWDFVTVKYNSNGVRQWIRRVNGPANADDFASDIVITGNGSLVFITGYSESVAQGNNFVTIKYNGNGLQQGVAIYNGPGNGDDRANAVTINQIGHVLVTGTSEGNGTGLDYATVCYQFNMNQLWTARYNGPANEEDLPNGIATDDNNNVYVTGYSGGITSTGLTSADFATVKYSPNGTQLWAARYNGTGDGFDEATAIAVQPNGMVHITGYALNAEGNNDIVTIKYFPGGTMHWAQIYDGATAGEDIAYAIALDRRGDTYITGKTSACGTKDDFITIKYARNGKIRWIERFNNRDYGDDAAGSVKIGRGRSVFVSGMSYNGETWHITAVKYRQHRPDVQEILRIRDLLELLAIGLTDVSQDPEVQQIVYDHASLVVDEYYRIRFDTLFARGNAIGIDIKTAMNATIAQILGTDPSVDTVSYVMEQLVYEGQLLSPKIAIPNFDKFSDTDLQENPQLAYAFKHKEYPIPCVNCYDGFVEQKDAIMLPAWAATVYVAPWYYYNGDSRIKITNCIVLPPAPQCSTCPSVPLPVIPSTGPCPSGTMLGYELEIQLGYNDDCTNNAEDDPCFFPYIDNTNIYYYEPATDYAILSTIPGMTYYSAENLFTLATIEKLPYGIVDGNHFGLDDPMPGDVLTLCENANIFSGWSSIPPIIEDARYGLAVGGVFKLERPGTGQLPMYFIFPYPLGLWYEGNLDVKYYYGTRGVPGQPTCPPPIGNFRIEEDYNLGMGTCKYCGPANTLFNLTDEYVASTSYSNIVNYWSDQVITVGIGTGGYNLVGNSYLENIAEFYASQQPPPGCTIPGGATLVGELDVLPNGKYEITKNFTATVNTNDVLLVYVKAKFIGEQINDCQTIVLTNLDPKERIRVLIRGNILDYNGNIQNPSYHIEVWKL